MFTSTLLESLINMGILSMFMFGREGDGDIRDENEVCEFCPCPLPEISFVMTLLTRLSSLPVMV